MIKWIFFDIGNVLIDDSELEKYRINLIVRVARKCGVKITPDDVRRIFPQASSIIGNLQENILECLFSDAKKLKEGKEYIETLKGEIFEKHGNSPVRAEAKAVLNKLSTKYHLGLIANQPVSVKDKLINAGIFDYFKHSLVSDDHGYKKPNPKYFEIVLKLSGANPKESVFIDDNIERGLVPAKNIGMTTVWYKTAERKDYPKSKVDFIITSLTELIDLFYKSTTF